MIQICGKSNNLIAKSDRSIAFKFWRQLLLPPPSPSLRAAAAGQAQPAQAGENDMASLSWDEDRFVKKFRHF